MNIRQLSAGAHGEVRAAEGAVAAARARLAASSYQHQCQQAQPNAPPLYYPERGALEETVRDISCTHPIDAVVTRNHYGSLVLNAKHALFIDVDMPGSSYPPQLTEAIAGQDKAPWETMLDDLHMVLASEMGIGFRIYRTAGGFRILATSHEFDPGSHPARRLMTGVGADSAFVRLCRTQKTFRARLTPKPWRCGVTRPPNQFPRRSRDEQHRFAEWLTQYTSACRDCATCQYIDHVGPRETHERIAPIIEFHDRATRALQPLRLA